MYQLQVILNILMGRAVTKKIGEPVLIVVVESTLKIKRINTQSVFFVAPAHNHEHNINYGVQINR